MTDGDRAESLESIRQKNIERNERFLAELMHDFKNPLRSTHSDVNTTTTINPSNTTNASKLSKKRPMSVLSDEEDKTYSDEIERFYMMEKLMNDTSSTYILRADEINQISCYLDRHFLPAPALVVIGPSGSGKSLCVDYALALPSSLVSVVVTCLGFNDVKQYIKHLYYAINESIAKYSAAHQPISRKAKQFIPATGNHGSNKTRNKNSNSNSNNDVFSESQSMKIPGTFGELAFYLKALLNESVVDVFTLALDRFENVEALESGLSTKFLCLKDLSHPKIKVIAITRQHNIAYFATTYLQVLLPVYSSTQLESIILTATKNTIYSNDSLRDNKHREFLYSLYSGIVAEALPRLSIRCNHPLKLLEEVACIWRVLQLPDFTGHISVDDVTMLMNQNNLNISAAIKSIAQGVLKLPTSNITIESKRRRSSSGSNTTTSYETNMKVLLKSLEDKICITTLQGVDWCKHLALSVKYLILAAFLASTNPKESDDHTFGINNKRGKRKRARAGIDEENEGQKKLRASTSRAFSLDRLMGIFTQIINIGGIKVLGSGIRAANVLGRSSKLSDPTTQNMEIISHYGDADIFGCIDRLVSQQLLVQANGWSLDEPQYLCTVSLAMAEELAKSLAFHLYDFIHEGSV